MNPIIDWILKLSQTNNFSLKVSYLRYLVIEMEQEHTNILLWTLANIQKLKKFNTTPLYQHVDPITNIFLLFLTSSYLPTLLLVIIQPALILGLQNS